MRRITALVAVSMVVCLSVRAYAVPSGATSRGKSAKAKTRALEATVRRHLLSVSDLPPGWSINNTTTKKGGLGATKCLAAFKMHRPKTVVGATVNFEQNSNVPILDEPLATGKGVNVAYKRATKGLSNCKSVTLKANGKTLHVTIGQMSFLTIGKKSTAYAVGVTFTDLHLGFDLVVFKVQKYIGMVGYADVRTPNITTAQAFAKEAVAKAEGQSVLPPTTG